MSIIMESLKKNAMSWFMPSIVMLLVSTIAIVPRMDERQKAHDSAHQIEKESEKEFRSAMNNKMDAYTLQINTLLDKVYEQGIIIQDIKTIADTKVRSIQGTQDAHEYRLRQLEK